MALNTFTASALSLLLFLASCQHPAEIKTLIKGKLTNAGGFKLTLQEMGTHEIKTVDSIIPDINGEFGFAPVVTETGFWLLKSPEGKVLVLLITAGDLVDIAGDALEFPNNLVINAPKETILLHDFFQFTHQNERLVDSLEILLAERQDSSDYYQLTQQLDTVFHKIWDNQLDYEKTFIETHSGSLASLVVLNYAFGMSPVLSPEEDFLYYAKVDSALFLKFPGNKHVKYHHQRVLELKRKITSGK
jgi:hypothetical protein